ncbi:MAG: phage replisome organizer N-terminal domain-containing protein [Lachnospiraceae bacterium]|jgi:predicted phage replisome organizer|nr:phage replisome organizer N-terminal domain-containing protein [Lachnospiraceae bacterium]
MPRFDKRSTRYFWIKLRDSLVKSNEFKLLMRQTDGQSYFTIYILLVFIAINENGKLIQQAGSIKNILTADSLVSELIYFKIDTVRMAIEILKELGWLYLDEENVLCISRFEELVGSETGWAETKRIVREKEQLLIEGQMCDNVTQMSSQRLNIENRDKNINKNINLNHDHDEKRKRRKDKMGSTEPHKNLLDEMYDFENDIEFLNTFKACHVFTKYLIKAGYLEPLDRYIVGFDKYFNELISERGWDYDDIRPIVVYFTHAWKKRNTTDKYSFEDLDKARINHDYDMYGIITEGGIKFPKDIKSKLGYFKRGCEETLESINNKDNKRDWFERAMEELDN